MKIDFMSALGVSKFIDTSFAVDIPEAIIFDYVKVELPANGQSDDSSVGADIALIKGSY